MEKRFAIIFDKIVDGVVLADTPQNLERNELWVEVTERDPFDGPFWGWTYENGVFSPPPPPDPLPSVITKVAFRFRFTDAEYAGIITAARTDAEVQAWYDTFNMVATIDLDKQRTKDGVANLVSKNLLTQARATEILTAPVQPSERG